MGELDERRMREEVENDVRVYEFDEIIMESSSQNNDNYNYNYNYININDGEIIQEQAEEVAQCSSTSSSSSTPFYLDKFTLYETYHNYYITGRDKRKKHWRVLKIDRNNPSELVTQEDPTTYSHEACKSLLYNIDEGCKPTGGLKIVTKCYGIVGFIKLLETYYILLITERREIGRIKGHRIYSISDYRTIPISHSNALAYLYNHTKENRYRKLLQLVDIRENFYFSCSYPLMRRVQQNVSNPATVPPSDGKMFIWNEYLTQQTRTNLTNTLWTVALIHGFFKQVELSTAGKAFILTIIARRSCQNAGTRFERRGVNEKGQAANDVEIEQIVWPHIEDEEPMDITSVVQMRASIPLRWSQKSSMFRPKPDIIISECNDGFMATQLHFQGLRLRYEVPTVILNLVKSTKPRHREYILHEKFKNAVDYINDGLAEEDRVMFLSLDLDSAFKDKDRNEFLELKSFAKLALKETGIFYSKMPQSINFRASFDFSYTRIDTDADFSDDSKTSKQQKGVLRSNCLDSLDRTNVAQYVYGMVALIYQLHALNIIESHKVDFKDPLADDLMSIYQDMGDALSQQYGGSPAHQKIFSKFRGQNKMKTNLQEHLKSLQRHCNNAVLDKTKQHAIDLFLGHIQPDSGGSRTPRNRNAEQIFFCEWLTTIYLRNLFRCIPSGFGRLGCDDGAEDFNGPYLTEHSGSSKNRSQEGRSMVDFAAGV